MTADARYDRHMALFGAIGQERIAATRVAIVGLGGLGSHVAQQLAYLGVVNFNLIDADRLETSNLNRLIGAAATDVGANKVEIAARAIRAVQPRATIVPAVAELQARECTIELAGADVVFGCVDNDIARLELVRHTSQHRLPYIDLASDVAATGEFGGRILFAKDGERCLSCAGELDQHALARAQMTEAQRVADDEIYGVQRSALDAGGPSVVSVNGVVASLAVTEFMVWRTGMREPVGHLNYRGDRATVGRRADPQREYCHYCMELWGAAGSAAEH
jgi:hypothetical protein